MARPATVAAAAVAGLLVLAVSPPPAGAAQRVTFPNALLGFEGERVETITGLLSKPAVAGPFAAVVILHTCGGLQPHVYSEWPDFLIGLGYAALTVDSFGSRGLGPCPNRLMGKGMTETVRDAYGALRYLGGRPDIDGTRVAVIGFSYGATVVNGMMSARTRRAVGGAGPNFRAGIAVYGNCELLQRVRQTAFPLMQIIGDKDGFAAACAAVAGGPVTVHMLPGVHHAFDQSNATGDRDSAGNLRLYDRAATEQAKSLVKDFLARQLAALPQAAQPGPAAKGDFLDEAGIRAALVGNTLRLRNARGQDLAIFFAGDGAAMVKVGAGAGGTIAKKWWIKDGMLCRTVGRQNSEHCTRVAPGAEPGTLRFVNEAKQIHYQARVEPGRRVAE